MTANFDYVDIFYLANTFTIRQLRHEIDSSEKAQAIAEHYRDTEYQTDADLFPWQDYANTCHEAIKSQQGTKAKTVPVPGYHIDIEAIKAKNDIVTTIEAYTKLRKTGRNFTGKCPIHHDKNPSLTIYPDQQTFYCYGCNAGGDVIAFIQAVEHTDFRGAAAILGER